MGMSGLLSQYFTFSGVKYSFLVDGGFGASEQLIRPYPRSSNPNPVQQRFNALLGDNRRCVEWGIGMPSVSKTDWLSAMMHNIPILEHFPEIQGKWKSTFEVSVQSCGIWVHSCLLLDTVQNHPERRKSNQPEIWLPTSNSGRVLVKLQLLIM